MPIRPSRCWLSAAIATAVLASGCLPDHPIDASGAAARVPGVESANRVRSTVNVGAFELASASGFSRVVAVSDVHGMVGPLLKLLQAGKLVDANRQWVGSNALVIVVGDSIDKGPDSIDVLDLWMALAPQAAAAGGRVVHLLGNHEAEFLANPGADPKSAALYAELSSEGIAVTTLTDPTQPRAAFLRQEPVAARIGRWLFCHAGLYPDMPWAAFKAKAASVLGSGAYGDPFLSDPNSILEAKDWWQDPATRSAYEGRLEAIGLFGVVQGHQPGAYNLPNTTGAIDGGRLIKIDNGMAPEAGSNPGHLLIFPHPADLSIDAPPLAIAVGPDGSTMPIVTPTARQLKRLRPKLK